MGEERRALRHVMEKRDAEGRITMTVDELTAALSDAATAGVKLYMSKLGQKGGRQQDAAHGELPKKPDPRLGAEWSRNPEKPAPHARARIIM